jgi:hypothetical protein
LAPLLTGFGIKANPFVRQAVALDVLSWLGMADSVIAGVGISVTTDNGIAESGLIPRLSKVANVLQRVLLGRVPGDREVQDWATVIFDKIRV